jgi:hypothetical protein
VFIKKTSKTVKGKTYVNHLLVESISTPKGPRHRVVCSLGNLAPAPQEEWLALARKIEAALLGRPGLEAGERVDAIVERVRTEGGQRRRSAGKGTRASDTDVVAVHTDGVEVGEAREAGPVHVGHQFCMPRAAAGRRRTR